MPARRKGNSARSQHAATSVNTSFHRAAIACADWVGRPAAFFIASACVIVWALIGPWAGFSDTWQLVINTGTTIATFLILFLIQNTQNRDTKALHLKLDELIRAVNGARSEFLNLESLSDSDLERLKKEFTKLQRLPKSD